MAQCINDLSQGPTFTHNKTDKAYIDATFIRNKLIRTFKKYTILRPTNDRKGHATIIITFRPLGHQPIKLETTHRINYDKINKDHFIELTTNTKNVLIHWHNLNKEQTINGMKQLTNTILNCLLNTQKSVTTRITKAKRNRHIKPALNDQKKQKLIT